MRALPGTVIADFQAALTGFRTGEDAGDGLGPVFNAPAAATPIFDPNNPVVSCATCHDSGGNGVATASITGGFGVTIEQRFGHFFSDGTFSQLTNEGGSLQQNHRLPAFTGTDGHNCDIPAEIIPADANIVAKRMTTALFGIGLVTRVADSTFENLATNEQNFTSTPGFTAHALSIVENTNRVSKFGWKAQVPTITQFAGDAYVNEMGITSPQFPTENAPQGNANLLTGCRLKKDANGKVMPIEDPAVTTPDANGRTFPNGTDVQGFIDFMVALAPLATQPQSSSAAHGQTIFENIGCTNCHVETLTTASNPDPRFNQVTFHPFSDFLLHNMDGMADGFPQGEAFPNEMRTAPLWGLRKRTRFLHDGRTSSVSSAISLHAGQGRTAAVNFGNLSVSDKTDLLNFLNTI